MQSKDVFRRQSTSGLSREGRRSCCVCQRRMTRQMKEVRSSSLKWNTSTLEPINTWFNSINNAEIQMIVPVFICQFYFVWAVIFFPHWISIQRLVSALNSNLKHSKNANGDRKSHGAIKDYGCAPTIVLQCETWATHTRIWQFSRFIYSFI